MIHATEVPPRHAERNDLQGNRSENHLCTAPPSQRDLKKETSETECIPELFHVDTTTNKQISSRFLVYSPTRKRITYRCGCDATSG